MHQLNTAWFANRLPLASDEECLNPFPDIENQTIVRFYRKYMNSKGDKKFRYFVLGLWTVDIKKRYKFLTNDPDNEHCHRAVIKGQTYLRERPENSRFKQGSLEESLLKRKIKDK